MKRACVPVTVPSMLMRRWPGTAALFLLIGFGAFIAQRIQRELSYDMSIPETPRAKEEQNPQQQQQLYFHWARSDRSGAVLEDMLLAHAHAHANHLAYGGACSLSRLPYQSSHDEMIRLLGLQRVLKFACPSNITSLEESTTPPIHRRFNSRIFRPDWLLMIREEHVRSRDVTTTTFQETVVVHIRRGDVSLCDPETFDRYLPNQHYIALLDSLNNTDTIHVYSEQRSFPEGWETLKSHLHVQLHLNASMRQAWSSMIQSKTLILSKSSFSFVPAIFATHQVIYTPFWVKPLPEWTIVDEGLMQTTRRATIRLRHELCEGG